MREGLCKLFSTQREFIVRHLVLNHAFYDSLRQENVLDRAKVARWKKDFIEEEIAGEFIDFLVKKDDKDYQVFINTLRKTGQDHIADKLNVELAIIDGGKVTEGAENETERQSSEVTEGQKQDQTDAAVCQAQAQTEIEDSENMR